MKIYLALPLFDERYSAKSLEFLAELRGNYQMQFKTKTVTYTKMFGYIALRYDPTSDLHWTYTMIQPEMFEPHRREVKR